MQISNNSLPPLIEAINRSDVNDVRRLLKEGESPNPLRASEEAPLQVAARQGNLEIVRELLTAGANVDQGFYPPIYEAVTNEHLDVVRELVTAGANIHVLLDEDGNTVLLESVATGNIAIVRILVEAGANVDLRGEAGTPLLEAIESGYQDIYEFLEPLVTNEAIRQQAHEFARNQSLITKGQKKRERDISVESFVEAASEGNLDEVRSAISQKIDVDSVDSDGRLALVEAVGTGHLQIVQALLEAGANPNLFDRREDGSAFESALMKAAKTRCSNRNEIINLLIQSGADVNLRDSYGVTALMFALTCPATIKDIEEGVKLLVQVGADLNIRDSAGLTVLTYAQMRGLKKIAAFLELCGAKA